MKPGKILAFRFERVTVAAVILALTIVTCLLATPARAANAPAAPQALTANWIGSTITLAWQPSANATSYNVYRSSTEGGGYQSDETGVPAPASGLVKTADSVTITGAPYYYVVTAVANGAESANSNEAAVQPLADPTGLTANVGSGAITLKWIPPVVVGQPLSPTTFSVFRTTDLTTGFPTTPLVAGVTAFFYTDPAGPATAPYYYKVAVANAGGIGSGYTNIASGEPLIPTTIHNFGAGPSPIVPNGALAAGTPDANAKGNVAYFGVSSRGGLFDAGTFYEVTPAGQVTGLYSFTGGADGGGPVGPVVLGSDGNFYGVTGSGGANGFGEIYRMTSTGIITLLHSFTGTDGATPIGGLVAGQNLTFYGVTTAGGNLGAGDLYLVDGTGDVTDEHDFNPVAEGVPNGGLASDSTGDLFGVTGNGGASNFGTVYMLPEGGTFALLHSFNGSDGANPSGTLLLTTATSGGTTVSTLYGVTTAGGNFGLGSLYDLSAALPTSPAASNPLDTLYSFSGATDGANPVGGLVLVSGVLYGTTQFGGSAAAPAGFGTVYSYWPSGAPAFSTVHTFLGQVDGASPTGALVADSADNLYGTTPSGGSFGLGAIFKIATNGAYQTLAELEGTSDGIHPTSAPLQGADQNFYATAAQGGTSDLGAIFQMTSTGAVTVLHSFTGGIDGANPSTPLVQSGSGTLYGVTSTDGGNGNGSFFSVTTQGQFTTLLSFPTNAAPAYGADGANFQGLAFDASGANLYGTAADGGTVNFGTVFKLSGSPTTASVIQTFDGGSLGGNPSGPLLLGQDGNLYGVTSVGGANNAGVVYKVTGGVVTKVADMGTTSAVSPVGGLVQAPDGNFYGLTSAGGTGNLTLGGSQAGTVYSVSTAGGVSVVYSFTGLGDGGAPTGRLVVGADHNLYGTTTKGGAFGSGTIFCVSLTGIETTLYSFPFGGASGLTFSTDTNFYGFTAGGGTLGLGTAFQLAVPGISIPEPAITVLNPTSAYVGGPSFTLSVNGSNFEPGAIVNWSFNSNPPVVLATSWVSSNLVTATVPQSYISALGTALISVSNPAGLNPAGVTSPTVSFAINTPPPTITNISPQSVLAGSPDTTVTINGTNFTPGSVIQYNGVNLVPTTIISLNEATAVIPAANLMSPGTGFIGVNNIPPNFPAGGGSATVPFSIDNPTPVIVSISQANAPVNSPGFTLTVTGSQFVAGSVVVFGGTALATTPVSAGELTAIVPTVVLQAIGTVNITVQTPAPGGGISNASPFNITPAIAYTFSAGLQLIAAPADYSGAPLASAFDVAIQALAVWDTSLNAASGNNYVLTPNSPADNIRPGQGYWVHFSTNADLFATGVATPTTTAFPIPLKAGWNMIGDPFNSGIPISNLHVLDSHGTQYTLQQANAAEIVSVTFYSYDSSGSVYVGHTFGDALYPYVGYWIDAFANCALVVTTPAS